MNTCLVHQFSPWAAAPTPLVSSNTRIIRLWTRRCALCGHYEYQYATGHPL